MNGEMATFARMLDQIRETVHGRLGTDALVHLDLDPVFTTVKVYWKQQPENQRWGISYRFSTYDCTQGFQLKYLLANLDEACTSLLTSTTP